MARGLYAPAPQTEEGACGFDLGHFYQNAEIQVWPENWSVVELFAKLVTQWQVGFNGAVGLRYESIYPLLDRFFADDWSEAFSDIRLLESEALSAMRKD